MAPWLQQLVEEDVVADYASSKRRLLVLGYNATLTTAVEAPRQPKKHFDQIKVQSLQILFLGLVYSYLSLLRHQP